MLSVADGRLFRQLAFFAGLQHIAAGRTARHGVLVWVLVIAKIPRLHWFAWMRGRNWEDLRLKVEKWTLLAWRNEMS